MPVDVVKSGKSLGFGFVEFETKADLVDALEKHEDVSIYLMSTVKTLSLFLYVIGLMDVGRIYNLSPWMLYLI